MKAELVAQAQMLGFALCRVARCEPPVHGASFRSWLEAGMAGEMTPWLERGSEKRLDPQAVLPGARSMIVLALNYWQGPAPSTAAAGAQGRVARYAWGDDYHDLIETKLRALDGFLQSAGGTQRWYVDTGPVLERDFAAEAGAGWHGKSTMLLHPELGTWYFLAEILTTLDLPPDPPIPPRCGSCTRCLDACPTGAIRRETPYHLDARLCISYLTIEHRGAIPLELRPLMGDRIYGCDDCLDACPWNRFAQVSREAAFQARPAAAGLALRDYLGLSEEDFRTLFRGSPIKRTKRRGLLRNVCVALGNVGLPEDVPALQRAAAGEEELIAEHARWAIARIQERQNPVPNPAVQRVAAIGAGVGGLACAALLAHAGRRVTLFERNPTLGGKLNWLEAGGYSWDTGPSLLTMPYVFEELWQKLGRTLADDLTLVPLPVTCRYHWTDGTIIDEDAAFWARPDVTKFLAYARGIYDLSADAFLHHPLDEWWRQLTLANLPKLRHLPKIASFQTMAQVVRASFPSNPHLQQLFNRFATYNGSSPYQTPAAFNIIPYVQARFGGWYVHGGLYAIARALGRICAELGVDIQRGQEVTALRLEQDESFTLEYTAGSARFDCVICNQDVLSAYPRFLAPDIAQNFLRTRRDVPPSFSSFLLYLGVERQSPELSHHNIFFSDDYPGEFAGLFHNEDEPLAEPTIYVAIPSKSDPDRAPPGCESWFVLVNAPALNPTAPLDWSALAPAYGDRIIQRLQDRFGLRDLAGNIRERRHFTPADFETRYLAHRGSLYGFASHGPWAAFQRPSLQPRGLRNFYFVGGSTHPGGGLPLVCLSAQMAATKILRG